MTSNQTAAKLFWTKRQFSGALACAILFAMGCSVRCAFASAEASADSTSPSATPQRTYEILVFARPRKGIAVRAFNRWYDLRHVPDMLQVPGIETAQRYLVVRADTPESTLPANLAWFEAHTASLDALYADIDRRIHSGQIDHGDLIDPASMVSLVFEPIGPRQFATRSTPAPVRPGGPAPRLYRLLAFTSPKPGREREFNAWYDHEHLPEVLRNPGFLWGQRYRLVRINSRGVRVPEYLACFEFKSADLTASIHEILHRIATGQTHISSSMARESMVYYVRPISFTQHARSTNSHPRSSTIAR